MADDEQHLSKRARVEEEKKEEEKETSKEAEENFDVNNDDDDDDGDEYRSNALLSHLAHLNVTHLKPRPSRAIKENHGQSFWAGIVVVLADHTFQRALHTLRDQGVLSAPVLRHGTFVGFVDMLFIVQHYLTLLHANSPPPGRTLQEHAAHLAAQGLFENAQLSDELERMSLAGAAHPIGQNHSLLFAAELLAGGDVHRASVVDHRGRVCSLVTESMLLAHIGKQRALLDRLPLAKVSVGELPPTRFLEPAPAVVHTISRNMCVHEALSVLSAKCISGAPVVDDRGYVVDALSIRDFRLIEPEHTATLDYLFESVLDFKKRARASLPSGSVPAAPITVLPDATLHSVIDLMNQHHVHRVYVIRSTEEPVPIRVISQGDVLRQLLRRS
eukprot:CAMPEP_0177652504 /NCGR_PEP_ID=MMETSP0447-20121125/13173_1 /TAXON_ID=0 /ORGANISM="Stygamoeba regulata, Strain BSH-02190019" /LENGTH=386 /DNA_ID=CAMNT_0019155769 /DNA_START=29 /DNA_END=1189 /DNA_ORIENTATION=+